MINNGKALDAVMVICGRDAYVLVLVGEGEQVAIWNMNCCCRRSTVKLQQRNVKTAVGRSSRSAADVVTP
jgi:hypothetical protein